RSESALGDGARAWFGDAPGRLWEARPMNDVSRLLSAVEQGDAGASEQLLPLVYDKLRKLATQYLAREKPGQTLQSTALVHEAYSMQIGQRGFRRTGARDLVANPIRSWTGEIGPLTSQRARSGSSHAQ